MSNSKLIELSYYDPSAQVRLSAYADTIVLDHNEKGGVICAIRFGGYPEMVRAMADAIYGGATLEATQNDTVRLLQSSLKGYRRQMTHDGVYAVATLMASDDAQEERAISSAPKETEHAFLRSWTTKRQHRSFRRFRNMCLLRSKAAAISDSWRSSRRRSGSTHGC